MNRSSFNSNQMNSTAQSGVGANVQSGATSGENQQPPSMNTAALCKYGAETVQDIVSRTSEVFSQLKTMQLPNGMPNGTQISHDRKARMQDHLNFTRHLFRRLKVIYEKVNNDCGGMDYTPIETLIPYKQDVESRPEIKKISDSYRHYSEEARELREQLCIRSRYLKEVIDQLRRIIWQINTMLAMKDL